MVNTFDALAKFGGEENDNIDTQPDNNTASVDLTAVISRLNDLENAINELRREKTAEQTTDNSTHLENGNEPNGNEPNGNNNTQGDNNNGD